MKKKRGPWTVTGTRVAYKNPWMSVREDKVITPSGEKSIFGVAISKDGVVIVPIDDRGFVHLIKEYKYPVDRYEIQAPGGGIDGSEFPLKAAKRELLEETGFVAARWTSLGSIYPYPSMVDSITNLYLAEGLTMREQSLEGTESIEVIAMPFSKALRMLREGDICDGESFAALSRAEQIIRSRRKDRA